MSLEPSHIRRANTRDIPWLVDIRNRLTSFFVSQMPATKSKTLKRITDPSAYVFILEQADKPVGTFCIRHHHDGTGEFGQFMVEPHLWSNGYGQFMLARALDEARKLKLKKLWLVSLKNGVVSQRVYRKAGFVTVKDSPMLTKMEINID